MNDNKILILKVLVGSHAHGLAGPDSDYDYRGVYVIPTTEILSLGFNYKGSHWLEGEKEDQTAYEIGHFLHLATHCNPSILEVMVAPIRDDQFIDSTLGYQLRELLQYCWEPQRAFDAFVGYGLNQRKKMLDNHLDRWNKYGTAYIRTLLNLCDLLEIGSFQLVVREGKWKDNLIDIRQGKVDIGTIINWANILTDIAREKLNSLPCKNQKSDIKKINDFLLKVRKEFWE